jgi:hypothetical protein
MQQRMTQHAAMTKGSRKLPRGESLRARQHNLGESGTNQMRIKAKNRKGAACDNSDFLPLFADTS